MSPDVGERRGSRMGGWGDREVPSPKAEGTGCPLMEER